MKIYTRTGDDGTHFTVGGRRVPKALIHALKHTASVDELIAWIGLLRDHNSNASTRKELLIYISRISLMIMLLPHWLRHLKIKRAGRIST
ncbi:MAG: ATP:cob(I)alamin adenosyltransferase [Marinilabiliales bacterium]|nr:ATP:cob(I)alamin adenosyltransferase [Marinilabiliales bacterium]